MKDYSTLAYTTGSYPNVVSNNTSGPGSTDGTAYNKQVIDDLWGARQAVMDYAGLTPNGTTESAGASQFLEAIKRICGYPGEVVAWHGNTNDPSSVGVRLLPLNGQTVLRTNYPELDAATYVGDANNPGAPAYYHCDNADGTGKNPTGVYLTVPDLRGLTIRGLDLAAAKDPQGAIRKIGDWQKYAIIEHKHEVFNDGGNYLISDTPYEAPTPTYSGVRRTTSWSAATFNAKDLYDPSSTYISTEIRMHNTAVHFCIRY